MVERIQNIYEHIRMLYLTKVSLYSYDGLALPGSVITMFEIILKKQYQNC